MALRNCHNVTDTIYRHFKKGDRRTYLDSLDYMRKNHIHFYLENCERSFKRLYVCKSIDGKIENAVPVETLSKTLKQQLNNVLKEIIKDKYICDIRLNRYRLYRDNDTNKYNITEEYRLENFHKKIKNITVGRPLYLAEMLDETACKKLIETADSVPMF